jgi:antitoxin (DNA-binding transcriptional repressor) of toxin-antitoxin stability system
MQEHLAAAADSDLAVIVEVIVEVTVAGVAVVDVVAVAARARYIQPVSEKLVGIDNVRRRRSGSPSPSSVVS